MQNISQSPVAALQDAAIDRLNWADQFTDWILDSLTEDQLMARAGDGGNHPLWVMGHLAWTNDFTVSKVSGQDRELSNRFDELFAGGTKPSADRSAYPSRDELRRAMQETRKHVIRWVKSLTEETAFVPVPEFIQAFAPNAIMVPFTIAAHELFHLGQVSAVRASLGLEPVHR